MKKRISRIGAVLLIFCSEALFSQIPNTLGWYEIPNTKMTAVCEGGVGTCANVINAWNSGVFDTKRNRLIIWGGGHGDYSGNELYALNLSGTPNFVRLNNTTAGGCSMESCDGGLTPNSRHTYDGIEYLPTVDRMYVHGGAMAGSGWCTSNCTPHTWTFNFANLAWQGMNASGANPGEGGVTISAYDPNTDKVFMSNLSNFYSYDYNANSYQQLGSSSGNVGYWSTAVVDPKRKKFVVFGGGEASFYDISGNGTYDRQAFATTGGNAVVSAGYPGLVYDPVRDRIVAYFGGNTVYSLNMDTKVWTSTSDPGNPGTAPAAGTYGRWNYSPALDVFVIVNSINTNAFIYRFPPADSTPSTAPGNLAGSALSDNAVHLTWTAASDAQSNIREYIVKRAGNEVGRSSSLAYTDSGLNESTQYSYTLLAVNGGGLESAPAGPVNVTTLADTARPVVTQVTASASGAVVITFSEPMEAVSAVNASNYSLSPNTAVQSASLSSDGKRVTLTTAVLAPGDYTLTLNNLKDRAAGQNALLPNTTGSFNIPNSTALVDFGAAASGNTFGLAGWNTVIKDVYTDYANAGPGGTTIIPSGSNACYNYQGVTGTARNFAAPEKITVSWYNNSGSSITFTPKVSFTDPDRQCSGTGGTWYDMTSTTVAANGSATSEYAFTPASAGSYSLVNVNVVYANNQVLICDKIDLNAGSLGLQKAAPEKPGNLQITCSPNPFSARTAILFSRPLRDGDLSIYDVSGKLVWRYQGARGGEFVWKAEGVTNGVYLLKVVSEGRQNFKKLLVQR